MSVDNDKIASLKAKLKSVTKLRLIKETEALKLRNQERSLAEELGLTKLEIELLKEDLEVLKYQISQTEHQVSLIDVCMTSEKTKIEMHTGILNQHLDGFQQLFHKEQKEHEQRIKEQREREAKQQDIVRKKEMDIAEINDQQEREAVAIEEECEAIDRECVVLKKRNNAIMLKLRKKLLETENVRRQVIKQNITERTQKEELHNRAVINT